MVLIQFLQIPSKTPELNTSLDESVIVASLVSSGFHYSVNTVSNSSELKLVPSIKSNKLWCNACGVPLPASLAGKISASKLFIISQVILQH